MYLRDSIVGIVTMPHAGQSGVKILAEVTHFSLLQDFQTGSGVHSASNAMGTRVFFSSDNVTQA
jgi:hypothetical protein